MKSSEAEPYSCSGHQSLAAILRDGRRTAERIGAADSLPKPMSFEALLHAVQNTAITVVTTEGLPGHQIQPIKIARIEGTGRRKRGIASRISVRATGSNLRERL